MMLSTSLDVRENTDGPPTAKQSNAQVTTGTDSEKIKRTYNRKWKVKRFMVWMRDDFRCVYCGQDLIRDFQTLHTATVDHVKPRSSGGEGDMENLVTACTCCNGLKGSSKFVSIEEGRGIIAARREKLMGGFLELAQTFDIDIPRRMDRPRECTLKAFETMNSLKAFVFRANQLGKQLHELSKRASRIDERLDTLAFFRELFEGPEEADAITDELTYPKD